MASLTIAVAKFVVKMVVATAISWAVRELTASDPDNPDHQAPKDPGLKIISRNTQALYRVIYGECKEGGNDVYISTAGSDNGELWVVMTIGEGELEGIKQVDSVDQVFFGDALASGFVSAGVAEYWFHSGSASQTYDTNLYAADNAWTDNLRYTSYIVFHLTFDRDYYQNLPRRTLVVQGRKLYDFRDATTAYSNNPVLCLYDYLTSTRYGVGLSSEVIDITSWTTAANYCDLKGWGLNLVLAEDEAAIDVIQRMLAHFRGTLVWYDGKYYLRYADTAYESSVMTIRDYNILQGSDGKAAISIGQPSRFDKPDGLRVKYTDPDKDYVLDDLVVGDNSGVIKEIKLIGCDDRQQAADLAVYRLERMQLDRAVTLTGSDDCLQLEPHDLITLNTTALGISDQLMRVKTAALKQDGTVDLQLLYESTVLYDDVYNLDTEGVYTCSLPDKNAAPPSVTNVVVAEETYAYRKRNMTRVKITFDVPSSFPWFSHVNVWISYDDTNWKFLYPVETDFDINNVEEGAHYYIRLQTVSIWGKAQNVAAAYKLDWTVAGYTDAPDSLAGLQCIVSQMAVILFADGVTDDDVDEYEFRLGSSWSGGIFLGALKAPNYSLDSVKPGDHTFWANTKSTNGEYGATARSAGAVLIDPPDNWTVSDSDTCDYNGVGTHSNTEHTTYASDDYLKCSHTGGVLTGTYTSPEYDLGASTRVLVYVLADIVVSGVGTTWDDKFPTGTTWTAGGAGTMSWAEIFELTAGVQVTMKIYYGDTSGSLTEYVERAEILAAIVEARYFKVEINITDPSADVNALVENFTIKYCT